MLKNFLGLLLVAFFGWAPAPRSTAVWQYSPGLYLPTDNVDAKTLYSVGALDGGGNLHSYGTRVYMPFTSAGGAPTNGQTVWLAGGNDDSGAGFGKLTATIPDTVVPPPITGFPYGSQNIVQAGICRGGEDVPGSGNYLVELAPTPLQPIPNTVPSDTTQTFHGVAFPGADYTTAPYIQALVTSQININPGESLVFTFTIDDILQTELYPGKTTGIQLYDDATGRVGWEFSGSTRPGNLIFQAPGFSAGYSADSQPGINRLAIVNTGGNFRIRENGGTVATMSSSNGVPGTTAHFRIFWSVGSVTSLVKLGRALSDAELLTYSRLITGTGSYMAPGDNPWAPAAALVADSTCQWYVDLTGYTGGTISATAGPAGSAFTFTTTGTPSVQTWTMNWYHSPASLFQFGTTPPYDQKHAVKPAPFSGFRFTAAHMSEMANLVVGGLMEDTDDDDEVAGVLVATSNGAAAIPITSFGWGNLGTEQYTSPMQQNHAGGWWNTSGALNGGPYVADLIVGAQVWRQASFASGMSITTLGIPSSITIDTPATSRLLVASGDADILGGQHQDFGNCAPWSAVITQMRRDYPGKIVADVMAAWNLDAVYRWGNGSMTPYAQHLYDLRTLGSPSTHEYLLLFGWSDWNYAKTSVAVAAARMQALINALHALDASATIWVPQPTNTSLFSTANSLGDLLSAYVTAWAALTSCTVIDVTTPNTVVYSANGNDPKLGATGQGRLAANFKAALGY